ncbi:28598_t:CDS:2, partial [Dentiscutata erythropus]
TVAVHGLGGNRLCRPLIHALGPDGGSVTKPSPRFRANSKSDDEILDFRALQRNRFKNIVD